MQNKSMSGRVSIEIANNQSETRLVHLSIFTAFLLGYVLLAGYLYFSVFKRNVHVLQQHGWNFNWLELISLNPSPRLCFHQPECWQWLIQNVQQNYPSPLQLPFGPSEFYWGLALTLASGILLLGIYRGQMIQIMVLDGMPGILIMLILLGSMVSAGTLYLLRSWSISGWLFYSLLGAMLCGGYILLFFLGRMIIKNAYPELTSHATARFANNQELELLRIPSDKLGVAIPLARLDNSGQQMIGSFPRKERKELDHVLVVAPTRGGKGLHISRTLWEWRGSVVVIDLKGDAFLRTAERRKELGGRVYLLDPEGVGNRYDPFSELERDEAIAAAAEILMAAKDDKDPVFAQRAAYLCQSMVWAARVLRVASGVLFYDLLTRPEDEIYRILEALGETRSDDPKVREAAQMVKRYLTLFKGSGNDDKFRASCFSLLLARMRPMMGEGVRRMMSGRDFTARDLLTHPTTVYIRLSEEDLEYTQAIVQVMLMTFTNTLTRIVDREMNGYSQVPVLFLFDEAKRIPIPSIANGVSTWAGRNIYAAIYVQDISQLEGTYGEGDAKTVLGNTSQIFHFGNSSQETAEYVSRRVGQSEVVVGSYSANRSKGPQDGEGRGINYNLKERSLITPDEFTAGSNDIVVVFPRSFRPVLARRVLPSPEMQHYPPPPPPEPIPEPEALVLPIPIKTTAPADSASSPPSLTRTSAVPQEKPLEGASSLSSFFPRVYLWPHAAKMFWNSDAPNRALFSMEKGFIPDPLQSNQPPASFKGPVILYTPRNLENAVRQALSREEVRVAKVVPVDYTNRDLALVFTGYMNPPYALAQALVETMNTRSVQLDPNAGMATWITQLQSYNAPIIVLLPPYPPAALLQEAVTAVDKQILALRVEASGEAMLPEMLPDSLPLAGPMPSQLRRFFIQPRVWNAMVAMAQQQHTPPASDQ